MPGVWHEPKSWLALAPGRHSRFNGLPSSGHATAESGGTRANSVSRPTKRGSRRASPAPVASGRGRSQLTTTTTPRRAPREPIEWSNPRNRPLDQRSLPVSTPRCSTATAPDGGSSKEAVTPARSPTSRRVPRWKRVKKSRTRGAGLMPRNQYPALCLLGDRRLPVATGCHSTRPSRSPGVG